MTERDDELITIDDDGKRAFAVCTMPNGYEIRERIPRHVLKMNMEDKQWHLTLIAKELKRRTSLFRMLSPNRSTSAGDKTPTPDTSTSMSETSMAGAESQPDLSPSRCEQWPDHQPNDSSDETTSAC